MKKKLQSLIQQEIDKLLMKIAEESGTSFKSNIEEINKWRCDYEFSFFIIYSLISFYR